MMLRVASHHVDGWKRQAAHTLRSTVVGTSGGTLTSSSSSAAARARRRCPWLLSTNGRWSSAISDGISSGLHKETTVYREPPQPQLALALAYDDYEEDEDTNHEVTATAAGSRPPPSNVSSNPYPPPSSAEYDMKSSSRKSSGGGGGMHRCK
jgi:hypothetical protein